MENPRQLVLGILDARTICSQFCDPFRSIGLSCTLFTSLNRRGAQGNVSDERGKVTTTTIAFVVAHVLFLTPIGIMNFYSRFLLGRKCHCSWPDLCFCGDREFLIICMIVYKTKAMKKTYQLMIANMAMSDLLYPIFLFPWFVAGMYVDSWPVSGRLGPILCKLSWFFPNVSTAVSIQDLILIAVDRFRGSSQQYKEVLLLNFGNLVVGYSNLLTIFIWCETRL